MPVDSQHWHVDGSIVARGPAVEALGHKLAARHEGAALRARGAATLSLLSVVRPLRDAVRRRAGDAALPELIPNFDELDRQVRALDPRRAEQPAGAIVRIDGLSLHRAAPPSGAGWRLWIRCVETDREVQLDTSIIECYGTVFRFGLS